MFFDHLDYLFDIRFEIKFQAKIMHKNKIIEKSLNASTT